MILVLLLAFCQHWDWVFSTDIPAYVPYEDHLVIPNAKLRTVDVHKLIPIREVRLDAGSLSSCVTLCLSKTSCVTANHFGTTCTMVKYVGRGNPVFKVLKKSRGTVIFMRYRATRPYTFQHLDALGGEGQIHRGYGVSKVKCFQRCEKYWSCTIGIADCFLCASYFRNNRNKCWIQDRTSLLKYDKTRTTRIVPMIKTKDPCPPLGGVKSIVGNVPLGCTIRTAPLLTAVQCAKKCNDVKKVAGRKCVAWQLRGSYAECTYDDCIKAKAVSRVYSFDREYISGVPGCQHITGFKLKIPRRHSYKLKYRQCKSTCRQDASCRGFTMQNEKTNPCKIIGGLAVIQTLEKGDYRDTLSFVKRTAAHLKKLEPCVFKGVSFDGKDTGLYAPFLPTYKTVTDCWEMCTQDVWCDKISIEMSGRYAGCQYRRFYSSKRFDRNTVSAVLRSSRDGSCFVKGAKFVGTPLTVGPYIGITSYGACKTKCKTRSTTHGDCYGHYFNSVRRTCTLYGLNQNKVQKGKRNDYAGQIQF